MKAKLARWGNSLALRLPAEIVRDFSLAEGQSVEITPNKPKIEIEASAPELRRRVNGIPVYTLDELLARVDALPPGSEPETLDWGRDRGAEIIDDEYSPGGASPKDVLKRRDS